MSLAELRAILPELIVVLAAILLLFVRRWPQQLALAGLALAVASLPFLPSGAFFLRTWEVDGFALVFKALFLTVAGLVVLGSEGTIKAHRWKEYYALVLFATAGMLGVASAADLIVLFVSFELSSLATYTLAAYAKDEERSLEAGTKFFIIGALSSAIALYGISLLYGVSGTTALRELARGAARPELALVFKAGMALVLAGFGFKITAVPFHLWAPDTYEGAPAPVTALLATGSKKMGFAALFKVFLFGLLALRLDWAWLFGLLAFATMTAGNLLALNQTSVKRLLAYSSIAQAGYILIAFPVATAYGLAGGLFQAITHSIVTAGAFLIVAAVAAGGLGEDFPAYRGLARRQPFLALAMTVFLLSLAGLPPLAGFQSKFVLFSSAVEAGLKGESWLIWLAAAGVLNSALSLYYYARIIKAVYLEEPEPERPQAAASLNPHQERLPLRAGLLAAIALAFALVILLGLYPGPLLRWLLAAARPLF